MTRAESLFVVVPGIGLIACVAVLALSMSYVGLIR